MQDKSRCRIKEESSLLGGGGSSPWWCVGIKDCPWRMYLDLVCCSLFCEADYMLPLQNRGIKSSSTATWSLSISYIKVYLDFLRRVPGSSHRGLSAGLSHWLSLAQGQIFSVGCSLRTWTWTWKLFIRQEITNKHDTISHRVHDSMFFFVGRPLQRHWAHRLRKGHPRVLQCINRHCTMKGQTFGSVGKLNTHTSWDRAPSRLTRGTQLTIIMRGKETKTSVLNTTS